MRIGLSAVKGQKLTTGSLALLVAAIVISLALFFVCENKDRPLGGHARPRPAAVQHRERTPGPDEVPIGIVDGSPGGATPGAGARSRSHSQNSETLRYEVADRPAHDLALLEAVERSGVAEAREAAAALLRLRDDRATAAALEAFVARDLARPPTVRAAARRWLDAELGPADAGAGLPEGRGPAVKRFSPVDPRTPVSP